MKKKENSFMFRFLHQDKLYVAFLVSYLLMCALTVVISSIVYFTTVKAIRAAVSDYNLTRIGLSKNVLDGYVADVVNLASVIAESPYHAELVTLDSMQSPNAIYSASRFVNTLRNEKIKNKIISSIYVYYPHSQTVISSEGKYDASFFYQTYTPKTNLTFEQWQERFFNEDNVGFTDAQTIDNGYYLQQIVEYQMPVRTVADYDAKAYLCIILDNQSIADFLQTILGEHVLSSKKGSAYIINKDDRIITQAGNEELVMLVNKNAPQSQTQTIFVTGFGNVVMIGEKSQNNNWYYVLAIPEVYFYEKMEPVKKVILFTISAQVFFGFGLAFFLSKRNYKPIGTFLNNMKTIGVWDAKSKDSPNTFSNRSIAFSDIEEVTKGAIRENVETKKRLLRLKPVLEDDFMTKLLRGNHYKTNQDEHITELPQEFKNQHILVAKIYVDDCSLFVLDYTVSEIALVKLIIINVMEEQLGACPLVTVHSIDFDFDHVVLIISIDKEADQEKTYMLIKKAFAEAQNIIATSFQIFIDIGLSSILNDFGLLRKAYEESEQALLYRMVTEPVSIHEFKETTNATQLFYQYSINTETKLINCVKTGDYQSVELILSEVFADNAEVIFKSVDMAKCLMFDMIGTAFKALLEMRITYTKSETVFADLLKSETLSAMKKKLYVAYEELCNYINANKKSHNVHLKDKIVSYLNEHFCDCSLSLTSVADALNLNSTYLSCFFKEQTGETFINYVLFLRMEKAKELLETTSLPMHKIADEVGYASGAVFIRVFKKSQGQTPGKYRESLLTKDQTKPHSKD